MSDTKLRHLFEEAEPGQEVHWYAGESRDTWTCEFGDLRVRFALLKWDRFRVDWDGGGFEAWVDHVRRAIASDGSFDVSTETGLVYFGPGPRILWSSFGDGVYLKWENGAKILHSGSVWRDSDLKAGVKFLIVIDGPLEAIRAPILLALPLLIQRIPPPPSSA